MTALPARSQPVTLEIVIPVFNEADVLDLLLERLETALAPEKLKEHGVERARLLFVDDGSKDDTAAIIARRIDEGLDARLLRFTRNFGHQSAVCAGLDRAEGDLVAVMDADLQDPPELLMPMVERWRAGADTVFGRRRRRVGNPLKRLGYWAFYRMVVFLSEVDLPLDSGDFALMSQPVLRALRGLPERLRFPRGLRAWVGFKQEAIDYDRPERHAGSTKYSWSALYRLATDGVAAMSTRPLQAAQVGSFFFGLLTLGFLVMLLAGWVTASIPKPFLLAYALIATGNAVQSFCLYIIGAYLGRTYLEVKGRPPYVLMELVERRAADPEPR